MRPFSTTSGLVFGITLLTELKTEVLYYCGTVNYYCEYI